MFLKTRNIVVASIVVLLAIAGNLPAITWTLNPSVSRLANTEISLNILVCNEIQDSEPLAFG